MTRTEARRAGQGRKLFSATPLASSSDDHEIVGLIYTDASYEGELADAAAWNTLGDVLRQQAGPLTRALQAMETDIEKLSPRVTLYD